MSMHSTQVLRRLALWAGLLPFALLSMLSDGVMPVRIGQTVTLVICSDHGIIRQTVDARTLEPVKPEPAGARPDDCPWAVAHIPAMLAGLGRLPFVTVRLRMRVRAVMRRRQADKAPHALFLARAPPAGHDVR
ncbi:MULTISPECIES: hypothetical protein [unclassified Paracoccus (in: a-proteobacteria)]|uniref:hypothetical protein n=1 Tax=unclassified Paracoccus (in: a-proteobacteria) TaxID=2688777 RepID=UPI0012B2AEC2|nr:MULTISPECIES: hypothetical protein [unclassified Paracoccus (in: a-proteobacteria)]UXU75157.1 hypothetical protein GB879_001250 [Paracoccus sp. SMMA_5]UXU81059.1 hypothetical protein GB880_001245 [Paracoccus sp. SMMA_5_TC]